MTSNKENGRGKVPQLYCGGRQLPPNTQLLPPKKRRAVLGRRHRSIPQRPEDGLCWRTHTNLSLLLKK